MVSLAPASARLAIVLSHPTQYYSPWFRWLAANTDLALRVFYLWDFGITHQRDPGFTTAFKWDVDLLGGYEWELLPNRSKAPGTETFGGLDNPTLPARLATWQPSAVMLFGYKYLSHLRTLAWARRRRVPLIFRGDSHALGRGVPAGVRGWLLRTLYRQFAALTYVGVANRDYFRSLGVPPERLFFAPHAVDQSLFDPTRAAVTEQAAKLRADLGIPPDSTVMLFAGKLTPAKQPLELLRAFTAVGSRDASLVYVGDGPEKPALLEAARHARPGAVHFLPFTNQSQMPARYALADLFVLPSRGVYETWGLAVNEAMHMGVPCVVSDRVGCQQDLVVDGESGWVFRHHDGEHLAHALTRGLAAVRRDRSGWARRATQKVSGYSYAAAAAGLRDAFVSITQRAVA